MSNSMNMLVLDELVGTDLICAFGNSFWVQTAKTYVIGEFTDSIHNITNLKLHFC
ncbi:hypothetical protein HJ01_00138 [Flavobacterium frigoris PS1]|uniref:Uncharacterized protein n=1 Tax=Flavobacterium frigoris (strain PS1) TaxID=1086011 RepID=H7FLU0_FLAFP|nr:hypothetical protein HJ01_00138 [Flavobacterium frigoris PS1]